ncbi:UDP-N-acetylglucosamine transferase subunit ALG13 [Blastocystis sp. ATCC 50177/Nand II]|uniref:UDP-N-acetylglucosamine transferase subunit ALG13 n=1 Tax=Blastocystis sp. subtype 1 (strain ATCC 50177 / NandII) TaxID=478820 RepID=A0A196SG59_BLAHN|nr:UDP-N-acetylglucosamine transferase subunit ALG13 [Blastocystis sp. ATCC 50177/Nand II]
MNRDHTLLITVGTTGFDDLIAEVCSEGVVRELVKQGFDSIIVQYGSSKSVYSEAIFEKYNMHVTSKDYYASLDPLFSQVRLVIGHAGAGTILDTLRHQIPLIVVVNEKLMGNHQHEIADAMEESNYLIKATPASLLAKLQHFPSTTLSTYPEAHPELFVEYLNKEMRFV